VTGGKSIAVLLQSISGVNAINLLVAFYDIHGRKRETPQETIMKNLDIYNIANRLRLYSLKNKLLCFSGRLPNMSLRH
jgi:hypothetical protein